MFAHSGLGSAGHGDHYAARVTVTPRLRPAVRAFLLDPEDRVLLARYEFPGVDVWCAPGGGVDDGEDPVEALARELQEEVGLDLGAHDVGPCVAHRTHHFEMPGYDGQEEWFYLVRCDRFEPRGSFTAEELRAENLHGFRWWSVAELHAELTAVPEGEEVLPTDGARLAVAGPRNLATVLERWLRDGVPSDVVELDV